MWWRRDPTLWPRSLLPRRILRDNDTVLRNSESALNRSRPFSRSQPTAAQQQHKDPRDEERWQHPSLEYRKWKKELERRLLEDPYKVLFGRSEERLRGLGFGRGWMEMGLGWIDREGGIKEREKKAGSSNLNEIREKSKYDTHTEPSPKEANNRTYPRKVNMSNDDTPTKPEPSFGPFKLGRSESSAGVASPSDPRRPREREESISAGGDFYRVKPVIMTGQTYSFGVSAEEFADICKQVDPKDWDEFEKIKQAAREEKDEAARKEATTRKEASASKEAVARERDFISEFLNESSSAQKTKGKASISTKEGGNSKEWMQTVLDRRAVPGSFTPRTRVTMSSNINQELAPDKATAHDIDSPSSQPGTRLDREVIPASSDAGLENKHDAETGNLMDTQTAVPGERFWPAMSDQKQLTEDIVSHNTTLKAVAQEESRTQPDETAPDKTSNKSSTNPILTRSTSDILGQLPKDDIDFLSAADIRASMGAKKNAGEEMGKPRDQLEKDFKKMHSKELGLDPIIESKIVNDKHIRRMERELKAKMEAKSGPQDTTGSESLLETSLDRLTKMIHDGGDVLTRYLWSDPVSASGAPTQTKRPKAPMLGGIVQSLRQNRSTMKQISQDLENDIPGTKGLLKGLNDFESRAIGSVVSLSRYRHSGPKTEEQKKYEDVTKSLRLVNYHSMMRKQIEEAYKAIDSMTNIKLSADIQERLRVAEEVLKENTQSTRMMWRSLMTPSARLAGLDGREPLQGVLVYHLRAMYDLQNSLLKIVERVMLRFGVSVRGEDEVACSPRHQDRIAEAPAISEETTPSSFARKILAAGEKLDEEILAQKSAMRGLSDDGYNRASEPAAPKQSLDEPKPLAHSLFRPFGLQLGSLGKDAEVAAEKKENNVVEIAKRREERLKDQGLVKEVRKAYEDVYGPITVDHRQGEVEKKEEGLSTASSPSVEQSTAPAVDADEIPSAKSNSTTKPTVIKGNSLDQSAIGAQKETRPQNAETTKLASTERGPAPSPYISLASHVPETTRESPPTTYKILAYNPSTDELSITTTTASPQADKQTVPLLEAIAVLDHPGKFLPHIPAGFDVLNTKSDMLVLCESSEGPQIQTEVLTFKTSSETSQSQGGMSPVDDTVRLSPTGYVGDGATVGQLNEQATTKNDLDGEWVPLEGKHRLDPRSWKDIEKHNEQAYQREVKKFNRLRRRGTGAGVLKTAIVAGAGCYALGVAGELLG
ncbi:hypothetical protein K505DRAFT_101128 [Melanomma pulvis-pyrius CBS 109.77]|uniref:Uncharacterized protein n=1 Tax=Melanomma pulvis-pyrius CBS 109.77 TaxID=1314802 RepID=A0A6A6WXE0_9PLEO|nr:hypothetical protein K505DRAFT_101128 [Melanomma pulvis-pyrius CBS 109.77]